jgi:hypothetical protein
MDNFDSSTLTGESNGLPPGVPFYPVPVVGFEGDDMVALKTERRVFLWRMRPHAEPEEAKKPVTFAEILGILEGEFKAGHARAFLSPSGRFLDDTDPDKDEKNQLYIADIGHDPKTKTVVILVNRGDPEAVAAAYLNTKKNTVRVEQPKADEAPGWSAHLAISTVAEKGTHRACFEKMPRVSSSLVLNLINRIVSRVVAGNMKYTYTVPVKTKQKIGSRAKPYRPVLDVNRVPSERLIDDLQKGELSGVTLTKRSTFYTGPGRDGIVRYQEQKVTLKTAPADPSVVTKFMKGLELWAKDNSYESITFHLEKLPHNQTNNPTILLDDQDALEQLYVRAQIISGFTDFLEACYPSICTDIAGKMVDVLATGHGW